jgi:hypothetical protein
MQKYTILSEKIRSVLFYWNLKITMLIYNLSNKKEEEKSLRMIWESNVGHFFMLFYFNPSYLFFPLFA